MIFTSLFIAMGTFDTYDELATGIVRTSYDLAKKSKHNPVDVPHLFFVLINQSNNAISELLQQGGVDIAVIKDITKKTLAGLLSIQDQFSISQELNDLFVNANTIAQAMGDKKVSIYHIFLSLLQSKNDISEQLIAQGITFEKMQSIIAKMPKAALYANDNTTSLENLEASSDNMNKYSEDLTQLAKDGKLKEVIGREKEFNQLIEILSRKEKNNVIILGESGVGKTALAEFLAQKIIVGEVPASLKDVKILRINLGSLVSGTKFRGEFEEKVANIIKTVKASDGKILLFIDGFHNVVGSGKAEGSMSLSEMLIPELSSGNIQVIGATTTKEYRQKVEQDAALIGNFETLTVQEPSGEDTVNILRGRAGSFEKHHGVIIYDTALTAAVELSNRYITDRKSPKKAIELLDQAAAKVKISMTTLPEDISDIQIKIGKLIREKDSLTQELSTTTDIFTQDESKKRIQSLQKEIEDLKISYATKKSDREKIKKIFEENKVLELSIQDLEKQAKDAESKSEFDKVSEIKYGKIAEIQKQITTNKEQIGVLQFQSGITIKDTVEREDIAQVVSEKTGIPLTKMVEEESQKLAKLEEYLSTKVIGQPEAISVLSNAIRRARIGLKDPKKPIGSFLFLGPTGVGKTEIAKALAEFLFFDKKAMVRLNMSEYQSASSVSKFIGSDPGLIGYDEGGQLTEAIRRKPYCVVLLDEVEKGHQKVFDTLLQVFDDGMITDNQGNIVDCKNVIFIMTSNIGSHEIMEKLQGLGEDIGDLYPVENSTSELHSDEKEQPEHKRNRRPKKNKTENIVSTQEEKDFQKEKLKEELKEELEPIKLEFFRPEFLNRLNDSIIFNPISPEMLKNILEIKLKEQFNLLYATNKITLTITNQAKNFLAKKSRDPANGARPIDRALERNIINPLAKEIIAGNIKKGSTILIDSENEILTFKTQ